MAEYKQSFYNINLVEDGYVRGTNEGITPYYNIRTGKFGYIPDNLDLTNPPQTLLQDGFIIPSHIDEQESYRQAQINAITDDFPKREFITIAVSSKCFYHCPYCFQGSHNTGIDMTDDIIEDTIAFIKKEIDRNHNMEKLGISWFGGEPLTNGGLQAIRKISKEIIPYCEEKGIGYMAILTTNGYNYLPKISTELKQLKVKDVMITVDGLEEDYINTRKAPKDAYKRVLRNIDSSVIPVRIRINVSKQNKDKLHDILEELSKLKSVQEGRNHIIIRRVMHSDIYGFTDDEWLEVCNHREDYQDVLPIKRNLAGVRILPCDTIQKRAIVIDADGYLYRCENYMGNHTKSIGTLKDGYKEGNIMDKDYVCSTITAKCLNCKYLPICCGSRCRYNELHYGKDCKVIKGMFRQNMQNYLTYVSPI